MSTPKSTPMATVTAIPTIEIQPAKFGETLKLKIFSKPHIRYHLLAGSGTSTMGTPYYMSPEQWNAERVDGRADVYATGVLLYEMLTGSVPFQAEAVPAIYIQHLNAPVPEISERLGVPSAVEAVVRTAMGKRAEDRFASAEAMGDALEDAIKKNRRSTLQHIGICRHFADILGIIGRY